MGKKITRKPAKRKNGLGYKDYAIILLCILGSIALGLLSNDLVIGGSLLATSLTSSYLASIGKRSNYLLGAIGAFLIAYVAYRNNLFGSFAVNVFIFAPLEILGFFSWGQHLNHDKKVKINHLTVKKSYLVIITCIVGSFLLGYILTLIPKQQLAFLDSTVNCLDICALILLNLRYKESWALWILSGILSAIIWTIAFMNGGESAFMRLIASISFIAINIYGAVQWGKLSKSKK